MWQAEADTELTLSASPTTAVGQKALFHGISAAFPAEDLSATNQNDEDLEKFSPNLATREHFISHLV